MSANRKEIENVMTSGAAISDYRIAGTRRGRITVVEFDDCRPESPLPRMDRDGKLFERSLRSNTARKTFFKRVK